MKDQPVVFFASKVYDNLGIGYMEAILSPAGYETRIIDFDNDRSDILKLLKKINPRLIGFSVIFQYHLDKFVELIRFLRENGFNAHFTAGGHYASLKYEELFTFIPSLDSIVRFEGEYTILELADSIYKGSDWTKIKGLAYRKNGNIITTPARTFEKDLDNFPFPLRSNLKEYAIGKKCTTIIAGRGCVHNCSFCNVRKFYGQPSGAIKRIRKPEMVVKEMEMLYHKKHCSVFLFVDDDFPLKPVSDPRWVDKFCSELRKAHLQNKIMWQICCRPDEVNEEQFTLMKKHGLFLVFLGIEDGTDEGLKKLNKGTTVRKINIGIHLLKKLDLKFDFGFLLFQPSSTFESLNNNLDFLKQICGDGYAPVTFLKMMPYYETKIEQELLKEGRLKISKGIRNYDFIDKWVDHYYRITADYFMEWLRYSDGLENISHWLRNTFSVYLFYHSDHYPSEIQKLYRKFKKIISESNLYLLDTMKQLSEVCVSGEYLKADKLLEDYKHDIDAQHNYFRQRINLIKEELLLYAEVFR